MRLMRTRDRDLWLHLQSGHGHGQTTAVVLAAPCWRCYFPFSLLLLAHRRQVRSPSARICIAALHHLAHPVVLPHVAPLLSRVIALASICQPYRPLLACARARSLGAAPPFTSCSTVCVLALQLAAAPLLQVR